VLPWPASSSRTATDRSARSCLCAFERRRRVRRRVVIAINAVAQTVLDAILDPVVESAERLDVRRDIVSCLALTDFSITRIGGARRFAEPFSLTFRF